MLIADGVFRKAFRSSFEGNCVEVAADGMAVKVRDSKQPDGPVLTFTPGAWKVFTEAVKDGEFDERLSVYWSSPFS